jgi:hypothetical protein
MKRLRALAVIAALWAGIFIPFVLVEIAHLWLVGRHLVPLGFLLHMVSWQAIYGAVSGALFGLVLMIAETPPDGGQAAARSDSRVGHDWRAHSRRGPNRRHLPAGAERVEHQR